MKAAVINKLGDIPRYEDFPDPVLNDGDVTVKVKAVILDYAVKALAAGTHFASKQFYPSLPAVVGYSGVGSLEDGTLVSFRGIKPPYGSMAEKVVIPKAYATPIPQWNNCRAGSSYPFGCIKFSRASSDMPQSFNWVKLYSLTALQVFQGCLPYRSQSFLEPEGLSEQEEIRNQEKS